MHECREVSEHVESVHAQDIQGLVEGPSWSSEAPPQLDPTVLMTTLTTLQGSVANLAALLEKQSTANNPSVAPAIIPAQSVPQVPHPPPQRREGTIREV